MEILLSVSVTGVILEGSTMGRYVSSSGRRAEIMPQSSTGGGLLGFPAGGPAPAPRGFGTQALPYASQKHCLISGSALAFQGTVKLPNMTAFKYCFRS